MVNGISDLLRQGGQFAGSIPSRASNLRTTRNPALAQMLIGQSQQTQNPLVAALTGFVGGRALTNIAEEQQALQQQQLETQQAEQAREAGLQERRLGVLEAQEARQQEAQDFNVALEERKALLEDVKTQKQIEKLDKELSGDIGALEPSDVIKIEKDLRKEFTDLSGEFIKQRDAFSRIEASAAEPSAAGDLSLIFNYMKLLDPGSVVREGEFATAQNAGGIDTRIRANYNRLLRGERLTQKQRNDFLNQANNIFGSAGRQQQSRVQTYSVLAERAGVNPENVTISLEKVDMPEREEQPTSFEGFKILSVE